MREVTERKAPLSEPERSGGSDNGAATQQERSPAVPPKPKRRTFTAAYKLRIVEEANACTAPGEVGALLRREGLYSSHLVDWRRLYREGALQGLTQRRGPVVEGLTAREKAKYERKIARLEARLRQAETIIDVQKKVSGLLGIPLSTESE